MLDNLWDPFEFEASLTIWHKSTLQYSWPMSPSLTHNKRAELRRAVTLLVETGACADEGSPSVHMDYRTARGEFWGVV